MAPRPPGTTNGLNLDLPVDDEDYLMPSPQSPFTGQPGNNNNHVTNTYMDLLSDPKGSSMFQYPPPQSYFLTGNFNFAPSRFFLFCFALHIFLHLFYFTCQLAQILPSYYFLFRPQACFVGIS